MMHVDDNLFCGVPALLRRIQETLGEFEVKGRTMDQQEGEINFLGRVIRRANAEYDWNTDANHRNTLLEELGMSERRRVASPTLTNGKEGPCAEPFGVDSA